MSFHYQTCRVCCLEIPAVESNEYSVHPDCMDTYHDQFRAELLRIRPTLSTHRVD